MTANRVHVARCMLRQEYDSSTSRHAPTRSHLGSYPLSHVSPCGAERSCDFSEGGRDRVPVDQSESAISDGDRRLAHAKRSPSSAGCPFSRRRSALDARAAVTPHARARARAAEGGARVGSSGYDHCYVANKKLDFRCLSVLLRSACCSIRSLGSLARVALVGLRHPTAVAGTSGAWSSRAGSGRRTASRCASPRPCRRRSPTHTSRSASGRCRTSGRTSPRCPTGSACTASSACAARTLRSARRVSSVLCHSRALARSCHARHATVLRGMRRAA